MRELRSGFTLRAFGAAVPRHFLARVNFSCRNGRGSLGLGDAVTFPRKTWFSPTLASSLSASLLPSFHLRAETVAAFSVFPFPPFRLQKSTVSFFLRLFRAALSLERDRLFYGSF